MISTILFDLDETLIEDGRVSRAAFAAAAALAADRGLNTARLAQDAADAAVRRWRQSPYFEYADRIGHSSWEGLWARYDRGEHPAIAGLRGWAGAYRIAVWQDALSAQGAADEELAAAMAGRFFTERRRYPLYPEVEGLLAALEGRYKLGIVTNGVPDLQREKIAGCGIAGRFQASVVSGEIDCGKPDPGIFRQICAELGVSPSECVMVGDNPARDVAGGRAAGMRTVWVERDGRPRDDRYPADLECTDLSAILPWLASL